MFGKRVNQDLDYRKSEFQDRVAPGGRAGRPNDLLQECPRRNPRVGRIRCCSGFRMVFGTAGLDMVTRRRGVIFIPSP
jgi:hypothetical protein